MKRLLVLLLAAIPGTAAATGFTDIGNDIAPHRKTAVVLGGSLRTRGEVLDNLDLDRGLTPSGQALFPVPLSDPGSQILTHADMRLRTDLAMYAKGGAVAVKVRLDLLGDLAAGSTPDGVPSASSTQVSPAQAIRVRRAYGEALTPFGLLTAGRAGAHWGLGMLVNGGDCADCDSGDAADRIAFVTPLAGLLWAVAYDFSASGPLATRKDGARSIDLDPADDVRSITIAFLRWRSELARERRRGAGKTTLEYGAYFSYRWQNSDVPAAYLPATPPAITPAQSMARGFSATALDGWLRLTLPSLRVETEAAVLLATVEQPSLVPGILLRNSVTSRQLGAALESETGAPDATLAVGLDLGYASGDPAPGFGAFPKAGGAAPQPGDLDGPQANPPGDNRVDNFRFHPDYRIDRILFHELIGTVTDAFYLRPHVRWRIVSVGPGTLTAAAAAVASFAVEPSSTPGGQRPLGIELDPTLVYQTSDGFVASLEHAVLLPLAGLDNPNGLHAKLAQLIRLRLAYLF